MLKFYHKLFIILKTLIVFLYFLILVGFLNTDIINEKLDTNIKNIESIIENIFKIFVGTMSIYLFFPTKKNIILTEYDKIFGLSSGILILLSTINIDKIKNFIIN